MLKISQLELIELKKYGRNIKYSNCCEECGGNIIFLPEIGDSVCQECGLVTDEKAIDISYSDKRAFTQQEIINREHIGPLITPLTPAINLHTILPIEEIRNSDLKR